LSGQLEHPGKFAIVLLGGGRPNQLGPRAIDDIEDLAETQLASLGLRLARR